MAIPASLRSNWRVPFPALVIPGAGISINKQNGIWTISLSGSGSGGSASGVRTNTFVSVASYVVVSADQDILVNFNGAVTLTLPPASSRSGVSLIVKDLGGFALTGNISCVAAAGDKFDDGATTFAISIAFQSREFKPVLVGVQWTWVVMR